MEKTYDEYLNEINKYGFTILKNVIDHKLIDKVIHDFDEWASLPENNYSSFNRVTNFHIYSKNTLDLVTNNKVQELIKLYFNKDPSIYSSLFFKKGTSQNYHRDTPYFFTNPIDNYCAAWYALEDVNVNAGPLKYYIGSHKIEDLSGFDIYNKLYGNQETDNIPESEIVNNCLNEYFNVIKEKCDEQKLIISDEKNYINKIKKGDVFIWHPKLLHGGSNIINESLTRYSMVTHLVPINTQVFGHLQFCKKEPSKEYLDNHFTYEYINHNNINIINHNILPRVQ